MQGLLRLPPAPAQGFVLVPDGNSVPTEHSPPVPRAPGARPAGCPRLQDADGSGTRVGGSCRPGLFGGFSLQRPLRPPWVDAGAPGRRGFAVQTHGRRGADWPPTLVCLPVHAQTTWVTTAASLTVLCAVASGRLCLAKHPTMLLTTRKRGSTCSVSSRRGGRGCAGPEVLLRSSRHRKTGTARPPGRRGSVRCTWCRPRGWEAAAPRPRPRAGGGGRKPAALARVQRTALRLTTRS